MTAQRICPPSTAFSIVRTKQKRVRVEDAAHLKWIRTLHCCICGAPNPDPAHIRSTNAIYGKGETGGQQKASDKWVTPLCRTHHNEQHDFIRDHRDRNSSESNEVLWWASKRVDPFGLALALHSCSGDDDIADGIIRTNIKQSLVSGDRTLSQQPD